MSQTIFPTLITSSFIPQLWSFSTGFNREYADLHYVKYPIAQGSQSFPLNLSVSGTTTLGGLAMSGANNITLGSGTIAPTSSAQLGYSVCLTTTFVPSTTTITATTQQGGSFDIPSAGVWLINLNAYYNYPASTTASYVQQYVSTNSASATGIIVGSNSLIALPISTITISTCATNSFVINKTTAGTTTYYFNVYYPGTLSSTLSIVSALTGSSITLTRIA
jgi:hypothetical protein